MGVCVLVCACMCVCASESVRLYAYVCTWLRVRVCVCDFLTLVDPSCSIIPYLHLYHVYSYLPEEAKCIGSFQNRRRPYRVDFKFISLSWNVVGYCISYGV